MAEGQAWPPDYAKVYEWRLKRLQQWKERPDLVAGAKAYYKTRPAEFINHWCDTYDPRMALTGGMSRMPFVLFDKQLEMVGFLYACLLAQVAALVEKSRDMGATWVCVSLSNWLWLFWPGAAVGWGSRKEQLVDKIGDPDSIFEKIRMQLSGFPRQFWPAGFSPKEHATYMKMVNPENGATITGEAGDNIGRGGRKLIFFKDEAQPLTSRVLTPDGWRIMADMRMGSRVIGIDGKARRVVGINECGAHPIYRVAFSDGTAAECSPNHLWTVDKVWGRKERLTLRTSEIAASYRYESPCGHIQYKYRVPTCGSVRFSGRGPLPLHPYVVGALLGDGSIKHVPRYRPVFTSADPEIVDEIRRLLPPDCRITRDSSRVMAYRLGDIGGRRGQGKRSRASLAIMAAGIAGHGAETKHIPDAYKFAAPVDRLALLQGLMDTDGSASGGVASFHSCSRRLAEDVRFIVQSLGGTSTLNVKPDRRGFRDMYVLHLAMPTRMPAFRLARKRTALRPRKHPPGRAIMSVELVGHGPARCITVDGKDGHYLTDHCIVTHNSAHYERPERIEAALADNTRVQVDISSVNGIGNVFYRRREAGVLWSPGAELSKTVANVFVLDWRDHPAKTQDWYDKRRAQAESAGLLHILAQEVDRNYAAALIGTIIKAEWLQSCIDAHIVLKEADPEHYGAIEDGPWGAGFDVADEGLDRNAFAKNKGIVLREAAEWGDRDTGASARLAISLAESTLPIVIQYDSIGVGAGVKAETNRLDSEGKMPKGIRFVPWNAGAAVQNPEQRVNPGDKDSPLNKDFFQNLKAQGWWLLARRCEKTHRAVQSLKLPREQRVIYPVDELISLSSKLAMLRQIEKELCQPTMSKGASMKLVVDKTPEGTRSPNFGDAIMQTYHPIKEYVAPAAVFGTSSGTGG